METNLWKVEISYSFVYGGTSYPGTFYVGADDVSKAAELAVDFLNKMSRFDKTIKSITDTGATLFQK